MADIFISYARADVERARPIAEALQAHGWDIWWDMSSLRTGQSFNKSIRASLGQAKCVVVLWSETLAESRWVEAEAYFAWEQGKLTSVVLDKSLRPPVPFNTSHAADLSGWSGDTAAPAYCKLVADLTETVGPPAGKPVPPAGSPAPDWASAGGSDRYGRWAELSIPRKRKLQSFARTGREREPISQRLGWIEPGSSFARTAREREPIIQRLRWIEPGSFQMGSPEDEPERRDNEGPRHEVRIAAGFWLFDTACTQALWEAVMGENPSRFKAPDRPVEQVSWDDAQRFIAELNERLPGLGLSLPSEAQWEHACRAGTQTPFSFGANIMPEQVNYDGNYPYAGGSEGEFRQGTVPAGSLPPNPWGLYEMHGNVWECVQDAWHDSYRGAPSDGSAWESDEAGTARVVRGGSWFSIARNCRSAYRFRLQPDDRSGDLGFRCARAQE